MNIETSKPVKRPRGRPRKRPTPATPDESRIFKKAYKEIDSNGYVVQDTKGVRQLGNEREEHVTIVRDGNQESGVVIDTSILSNQNLIKQQRIINENSSLFTCDGIPMGEGVGDGQNIYQQMATMSQESGSNPYNDSHAISNNAARSQFDIEESLYNEAQHNGLTESQSIRNFDGSQHQFSEDVQDQYEGGSQRTESDPGHYPGNSQDQFIGGGLNEQNTYANSSDMTSNQGGGDTFTRRGSEENSRSRRPSNRKSNENSQLQARTGKEYEQLNNCQFPPSSHAMDATPFVTEDSQSAYNQMWFPGQNRPLDSGFAGEPMPLHYPQVPQPMMSDGNPYQQHYTMEGGVLTPRVDAFGATDFSRAGQNLSNMYYMAPNEGVQFPVDGSSSANMMMHENMNIALPSSFYPAVSSLQSRPASETTKPDEILTAEEVEAFKERESRKEKKERIKRPRNAFLVWATPRRKALAEKHPGMNNADISVKLGEMWRAMTNADKQPFYDEAARIKAQHKKDHPDWNYQPKPKKKRLGQGTTWVYAITENPRGGRHINYINTYNNYDGNMSIGNMGMNSMNMGMMMGNQTASAGTGSTGPTTSLPPGMLHMPQMHHPMQAGPPPSLYLNKPSTSESGPTTADSGSTNEPIDIVSDSPTPNETDTVEQQASPEPIPA